MQINPNHTPTLANKGVALYRVGRLQEAQETFAKVLALDPKDAATHYLLGATQLQQGDNAAAEASFRQALEINPQLPEAHFGLGTLYKLQGKTQEAITEFEAFLAGPVAQDPQAQTEAERLLQELRGQ